MNQRKTHELPTHEIQGAIDSLNELITQNTAAVPFSFPLERRAARPRRPRRRLGIAEPARKLPRFPCSPRAPAQPVGLRRGLRR